MSLFGKKSDTTPPADTAPVPTVDPNAALDRVRAERRRRLASGGTQSTFLGRSMGVGSDTPKPLLTQGS